MAKKYLKNAPPCHVVAKGGKNKIGPALYGVLGRQSAQYQIINIQKHLLPMEKNGHTVK